MIAWIRHIRIKRLAKKLSVSLIEHFGKKQFYTSGELEDVCSRLRLSVSQRNAAYTMFAEQQACQDYLANSGRSAIGFRNQLGMYLFKADGVVEYSSLWNRFHDFNNTISKGMLPLFGKPSVRRGQIGSDDGSVQTSDTSGPFGGD